MRYWQNGAILCIYMSKNSADVLGQSETYNVMTWQKALSRGYPSVTLLFHLPSANSIDTEMPIPKQNASIVTREGTASFNDRTRRLSRRNR